MSRRLNRWLLKFLSTLTFMILRICNSPASPQVRIGRNFWILWSKPLVLQLRKPSQSEETEGSSGEAERGGSCRRAGGGQPGPYCSCLVLQRRGAGRPHTSLSNHSRKTDCRLCMGCEGVSVSSWCLNWNGWWSLCLSSPRSNGQSDLCGH